MFRNMFSFPRSVGSALILSLSVMVSGQVSASPITLQFDFTATGFSTFPTSAPVDPVIGSVTVTFDPLGEIVTDATTGITLNSLNIDLGSPIAFNYNPGFDALLIGGLSETAEVVSPNTEDFSVLFLKASTSTPTGSNLSYATLDSRVFFTISVSVTSTPSTPPAPPTPPTLSITEPGTVVIFGLGLVGLGYMRRGRVA